MLVMLCKESALTRVINAGHGNGLESWRQLVMFHEPASLVRHAGLLLELLSFSFEGDVTARLAAFDREAQRYEASSYEDFPDNIRIGVVLRQLPEGGLRQHLILNSSRVTTWALLKQEVESVRRAQMSLQNAAYPMDVSELSTQLAALGIKLPKGKGGKGGGKTPGKSSTKTDVPTTPCPLCKKIGHWKRDCWYNETPPKGTGKGTNKGKTKQTAPGKGAGTNQQSKCWNCGEAGHRSAMCKKPKKAMDSVSQELAATAATPATTTLAAPAATAATAPSAGAAVPLVGGTLRALYLSSVGLNLAEPELGSLAAVSVATGRREVLRLGVDSGAACSVLPPSAAADYPLVQDQQSGTKYVVANGHEVKDHGLRSLLGECRGRLRAVRTRVSDVHKPLLAVYDMCMAGQRVVFEIRNGKNESYAEHVQTGVVTPFELRNRVWEVDFEVVPHSEIDSQVGFDGPDAQPLCPFQGQVLRP